MLTLKEMDLHRIDSLVKENVSFYWEADDTYPVLEVFRHDNKDNVLKLVEELKEKIKWFKGVETNYEELGKNYFRIMLLVEPNENIYNFISLSEILKGYGSNTWEDVPFN